MTKIDWKRKLSSRKFWAAVVSYITGILAAFNISDAMTARVTALLVGVGALITYIFAETYIDAKALRNEEVNGGDDA